MSSLIVGTIYLFFALFILTEYMKNDTKSIACIAMALITLSPLAIDIYLPAFHHIAASFQVETSRLQASITLFMISLGLGQLFVGPMADKYGRKPIAYFGVAIYVVSSIAVYFSTSIEMLLAARFIQGFGASATTVVAFALVKDNFNQDQSYKMISYLNGAMASVPVLAPLLGHWLTTHYGWRSNFVFLMLTCLFVGLTVWKGVHEAQRSKEQQNQALFSIERYTSILKVPSFVFHAVLCALTTSAVLAYITSAPIWLVSGIGSTTSEFTFWFTINAVLNICAYVITPRLIKKHTSQKLLKLGLMLLIAAGLLMQLLVNTESAWGFMLPIFIASFGFAFIIAPSSAHALNHFPNQAGTAAAMLGLIQLSGSGLITTVTQSLDLITPDLITAHLWIVAPALIIVSTRKGKLLHSEVK